MLEVKDTVAGLKKKQTNKKQNKNNPPKNK